MKNRLAWALVVIAGLALHGLTSGNRPAIAGERIFSPAAPALKANKKTVSLRNPIRISLGDRGYLYVTDYSQGLVATIDGADLGVISAFEINGRPLGIAWGRGLLYIGNETTGRVEIYTGNGRAQGAFETMVRKPTDIAFDELSGLLYVLDGYEKNVKVFDEAGTLLKVVPKPGVVQEGLTAPTSLALDTVRGEVLVSDCGDPSGGVPAAVRVYDYEGLFRFMISGEAAQIDYGFSRPQGLYVGSSGNFYMADSVLGKVLVFDRSTLLGIAAMGSFGTGAGELMLPLDVVIAPNTGDVFVTDNRNGRVEAFRAGGLR